MVSGWVPASLAGMLLLCAAALLWRLGRRLEERKRIRVRLDAEMNPRSASLEGTGFTAASILDQMLQRAAIAQRPGYLWMLAAIGLLAGVIGFLSKDLWGLATALAAYCTGILLYLRWRAAVTHRTLLQQLPGFIDHLIRIIGIGRSFDNALLEAIEHSTPPLSETMRGVMVQNSLGGDLVEALRQTARVYRIKELHLLTLALRINQRYGGTIRFMLENIVALIRQREQADRELRALTGETRLTAWIIGALPLLMAAYMLAVNPSYLQFLLHDPYGMEIIALAVGLEAVGGLLLWRMTESVR